MRDFILGAAAMYLIINIISLGVLAATKGIKRLIYNGDAVYTLVLFPEYIVMSCFKLIQDWKSYFLKKKILKLPNWKDFSKDTKYDSEAGARQDIEICTWKYRELKKRYKEMKTA